MVDTFFAYAQGFIDFVRRDPGAVVSRLRLSGCSTQHFLDANGVLR